MASGAVSGAAIDTVEDRVERFERARHPQVRQDLPQPVAT